LVSLRPDTDGDTLVSSTLLLFVDFLSMNDCLYCGGTGEWDDVDQAINNCFPGAVYSSVRAYDSIFPGW